MKHNKVKKLVAGLSMGLLASAVLGFGQTVDADDWGAHPIPIQPQVEGFAYPTEPVTWGADSWTAIDFAEVAEGTQADSLVATDTSLSSSALATATANSSSSNLYPIGQCTWGVKELAPWVSNYWGNGGDWAANAAADGFTVGTTPVVGAIAVWTDGGYGHVALVTDVVSETSIQVLEANVNGNQTIANHRGYFDPTTAQGVVSYIYPAS